MVFQLSDLLEETGLSFLEFTDLGQQSWYLHPMLLQCLTELCRCFSHQDVARKGLTIAVAYRLYTIIAAATDTIT